LDEGDNFLPFRGIIFYTWWHIKTMLFQDVLESLIQKGSIEGERRRTRT
jgi:hypothetical protein